MPPKMYRARVKKKRPTNPRLKAYLEAGKNETILLGPVARYLQTRPDPRPNVIHPSEMAKAEWCPRATWHRLMEHPVTKEVAPHALRSNLIFAEGHEIHYKWQTWLREMGILWGRWECLVCGKERWDWADNVVPGVGCGGIAAPHMWRYREVPVGNADLLMAGHGDGVVNPTAEENLFLEAKSIGPGTMRKLELIEHDEDSSSQFSKITRPLGDHFRQTQIYLRLFNEDTSMIDRLGRIDRGIVLYEHKADQQVREFPIVYNPRWTDDLFDVAADVAWAVNNDRDMGCPYGGCSQCKIYEEN